jgi:hypothetical protein
MLVQPRYRSEVKRLLSTLTAITYRLVRLNTTCPKQRRLFMFQTIICLLLTSAIVFIIKVFNISFVNQVLMINTEITM